MRLHLFDLFGRNNDFTSTLADFNELEDFALFKIFLATECPHALLLLLEALVVFHSLVKLRILVIADVHEILLFLQKSLLLSKLLVILDYVMCCLFNIMQADSQTDDLKFLLFDSSIVENAPLVQAIKLLLKSGLDFDNLLADP